MKDLRLSEHFIIKDFERSATAQANNIDNRLPSHLNSLLHSNSCVKLSWSLCVSSQANPSLSVPVIAVLN